MFLCLDTEITCAVELLSSTNYTNGPTLEMSHDHFPGFSGFRGILIGMSNGLVCLLDLRSSKIIRTLRIGRPVTSLEVIGSGGPDLSTRALAEEVSFGCVKIFFYVVSLKAMPHMFIRSS